MLQKLLSVIARLFEAKQWKGILVVARSLWHLLCHLCRCRKRPRRPPRGDCCIELPPDVYKRADPLLYAQFYLMKMGLAVTWDNPDIQLYEAAPGAPDGLGAPVSSSLLKSNHPYKVRVRVWNGSYAAPAVGLPVHLSYLSFGAGTQSHAVGTSYVDLGVKGSAQQPAFAILDWKTPPIAGHYCLQARLEWSDDANPNNNLGQENTDVGALKSPAELTFTLRNDASVRRRYVLEADAYRLLDPRRAMSGCGARRGSRRAARAGLEPGRNRDTARSPYRPTGQ
jgi:hypothetical protein